MELMWTDGWDIMPILGQSHPPMHFPLGFVNGLGLQAGRGVGFPHLGPAKDPTCQLKAEVL